MKSEEKSIQAISVQAHGGATNNRLLCKAENKKYSVDSNSRKYKISPLIKAMETGFHLPEDISDDYEKETGEIRTKKYSSHVMHLRSLCGNGIKPKDIEDNERLTYLLSL